MALDTTVKVALPPHSVKVQSKNGIYVQYTIRAYRNEKGKPTSESVSIGKLDPETGMLIPNRKYYEIINKCGRLSTTVLPAAGSLGNGGISCCLDFLWDCFEIRGRESTAAAKKSREVCWKDGLLCFSSLFLTHLSEFTDYRKRIKWCTILLTYG